MNCVIARSATGRIVFDTMAVLGLELNSLFVTLHRIDQRRVRSRRCVVGTTVIESVTGVFSASSPKLAVTFPPAIEAVTPGTEVVAVTFAVMSGGSVSVKTTPVAFEGPLLVAVIVYFRSWPT